MNCPSNPTKLYKYCCKKEYKKLEKWTKSVEWVKLEIINATKDTVHFNAFFL
jgi:SEC-C motif-containing protein